MPVIADSYMGVFEPRDIPRRVMQFMASQTNFPFIKSDELVGIFYLFGKDHRVDSSEVASTSDLARRTVERIASDIRLYRSMPAKLDSNFTRQNYTKRSLQIVVDNKGDFTEVDRRVAADPAILADCFAQHVSYYHQDFFFELFGPLRADALPSRLTDRLEQRMVLVGYNVKDRGLTGFSNPLEPFVRWLDMSS